MRAGPAPLTLVSLGGAVSHTLQTNDRDHHRAEVKPEVGESKPELPRQNTQRALPSGDAPDLVLASQAHLLAEISPSGAISVAWTELEGRLQRYLAENKGGDTNPVQLPASQLLNELLQRKLIDRVNFGILSELRQIRNKAVHNQPAPTALTAADAIDYVELAAGFIRAIELDAARGAYGQDPAA